MPIDIQGTSRKKTFLIRQVIEYMMNELKLKNIFIDVEVSNLFVNEKAYGFCSCQNINEFLIELDKTLNVQELIETICHEMIHVKQYATGELVEKGKNILYKNCLYESSSDSSPWEKEAYEKEIIFADKFINTFGIM